MDFVVDGSPERCLDKVEEFFYREWPYGGGVKREGNTVRCIVKIGDSGLRTLVDLFLTIVTVFLWTIWWLIRPTTFHQVRVFASSEDDSKTRLSISATHAKYADAVEDWIQKELVENRAASGKITGFKGETPVNPTNSDISDHIRKLAELRDAEIITEEEFKAKKAELLKRM